MAYLRNYDTLSAYDVTDLSITVPIAVDANTPGEFDLSTVEDINVRGSDDLMAALIAGDLIYYDGTVEVDDATLSLSRIYGTIVLKNTTGSALDVPGLGITIDANGSYFFNPRNRIQLQNNSVFELVSAGSLVLNNGAKDMLLHESCAYIFEYSNPMMQDLALVDHKGNEIHMLMSPDPYRSNKLISAADRQLQFLVDQILKLDWIPPAHPINHAEAGITMAFDGTITGISSYTYIVGVQSRVYLYINDTKHPTPLLDVASGTNVSESDFTLDIDFNKGDKLRLRAGDNADSYPDVDMQQNVFNLHYSWRRA